MCRWHGSLNLNWSAVEYAWCCLSKCCKLCLKQWEVMCSCSVLILSILISGESVLTNFFLFWSLLECKKLSMLLNMPGETTLTGSYMRLKAIHQCFFKLFLIFIYYIFFSAYTDWPYYRSIMYPWGLLREGSRDKYSLRNSRVQWKGLEVWLVISSCWKHHWFEIIFFKRCVSAESAVNKRGNKLFSISEETSYELR